jgi:hypothetical protein
MPPPTTMKSVSIGVELMREELDGSTRIRASRDALRWLDEPEI